MDGQYPRPVSAKNTLFKYGGNEKLPYDLTMSDHESFTNSLYGKKGIHSLSVMPGGIATNLQAHTPDMAATFDQPEVAAIMKSPAQGAATTVWAAIGREWMNEGGLYLENCTVAEPWKEETGKFGDGYAPTAYNPEDEDRLWRISCELVGVTSEI